MTYIAFFSSTAVACRLHVIYVREDNDCVGYDYTAYMDYMDLAVRERPLNALTHSLPLYSL